MTTPRTHSIVSLAAAAAVTLVLGACAQSRQPLAVPEPMAARPGAIVFENEAREHVRVYLIGQRREWALGRVEPGAVATLRLPDELFGEESRFMRLAVIAGDGLTQRAALDPRATLTVAQPASAMMLHRWTFAQGQLTPMGRP
jgi:hypothetical protein